MDDQLFRGLSFGNTAIQLALQAGEDVRPRQLTTETYGDLLWPTLHRALDLLLTLPPAATLTVVNRFDVVTEGEDAGHQEDRFLVTRPKLRTARDRLGRTWNAEAAAYLDAAPTVVNVALDVPTPDDLDTALPCRDPDRAALTQIADAYDAHSPIERLLTALGH